MDAFVRQTMSCMIIRKCAISKATIQYKLSYPPVSSPYANPLHVMVVAKEKVIFKATPKGRFPVDRPRCCLRQCDTWQYDIYLYDIFICRDEIPLICYNWVCNRMENPKSWKISFIFITVLPRSHSNCYLIDCNATRTPWMGFYKILNIYNVRPKRNYNCIHIMMEIRWWSGYFQ